jgi:FkbM family methyltransferase
MEPQAARNFGAGAGVEEFLSRHKSAFVGWVYRPRMSPGCLDAVSPATPSGMRRNLFPDRGWRFPIRLLRAMAGTGRTVLKQILPERTRKFLRAVQRDVARLKLSARNAKRAFRPYETCYRLNIGNFGDFVVAYREGTADEPVIDQSFKNDIYFAEMAYRPRDDDVLVDVGAHIGTFSLLAASKVPSGLVYAIEPSRESYNYLRLNVELNHAKNIKPICLALAGEKGEAFLHHDDGNWGHSIMRRFSVLSSVGNRVSLGGEKVPSDTLAGFMRGHGITGLDFIKFNCEGAEFPIILHTPSEILGRIRNMLVLYHLDLAPGYSLDGLVGHLHASGFRTEFRYRTDARGWIIATRD